MEGFAQGGRTVVTSRVYPTKAIYGAAKLFLFNNATGISVKASIKIWKMGEAQLDPFPLSGWSSWLSIRIGWSPSLPAPLFVLYVIIVKYSSMIIDSGLMGGIMVVCYGSLEYIHLWDYKFKFHSCFTNGLLVVILYS